MQNQQNIGDYCNAFCPNNYLQIGLAARNTRQKKFRILLEKRKIPETGWNDEVIEEFINFLSSLDSNNFEYKCGLGEREARIASSLVAKRHYNFGHGIGRSGDLLEPQPKAAGSTILAKLTNTLLLELIQYFGIRSAKSCFIVPMATGMTLNLCFLTLKKLKPNAKYVLWSRIDQKACFKCITTSGLIPIIINQIEINGIFSTNLTEFEKQIHHVGTDDILCIFSTTSCFAPRNSDNITELAKLCQKNNLYHLINNAYGLQSSYLTHQIEQGHKSGKIDLFVQSTDKNLMVPVGGAIVAGFNDDIIKEVSKTYVGRASSSQTLDVLITMLSLGLQGFSKLVNERKDLFKYLEESLKLIAENHSESLINSKNPVSIAMTLTSVCKTLDSNELSKIGSMLFTRGVSGTRIITGHETKSIDFFQFNNWGSHGLNQIPYVTAAVGIGCTRSEIDIFKLKLDNCFNKNRKLLSKNIENI